MVLNGSEIIIECLKEQGVDTIFGYPGGAILNVYDALYRHRDEIRHVLTSHEQGASHAADGYARATGKVGVCFATSGPGATNLVTGIATAHMDSVPIVAITCNVTVPLLGKDSFQEVDIAGITTPITKHNFIVKDVEMLAATLRRAFKTARSGRPGPVLVDVTKDVTAAKCEYEKSENPDSLVTRLIPKAEKPVITQEAVDTALEMIREAKKPFIFVGGGAVLSGVPQEKLVQLADRLDAPVCDSLMGKGAFDGTNPRYTGMLGMHGTKGSNLGVSECDLLIALGTRFSDRVLGNADRFCENAKILQIDIDEAEVNKNKVVDAQIIGDLAEALELLLPQIPQMHHEDWMSHVKKLCEMAPLEIPDGLNGPYVIDRLYQRTGGKALITTEVGQHQMWAAQFYKYHAPRQLLTSGGLGTMGYGLGAAIGASIGRAAGEGVSEKGERVFNIAGDGCFRMNMNELATAVREQLPLVEIVINNHVLGMVRQWQDLFYDQRYSATVLRDSVDYVKLAEAMGATGISAKTREEFDRALDQALAMQTPVVIDVLVDSDDKVWPMVAPGKPIADCFDGSDI